MCGEMFNVTVVIRTKLKVLLWLLTKNCHKVFVDC